jgi:hypothetical protein
MTEHNHDWHVFSTILDKSSLLVRCECGAVGVVEDPSKAEWNKAFHAPSHPYQWGEPDRVKIIPGYTTAWDDSHHVWTVTRG